MSERVVLGIHDAHDASACLMVGGKVVAAAQEERFSGLKVDYGYPKQAIEACLRTAGLSSSDIDQVVLASHSWNPVLTKIKRNANFSVQDWVKEQREFWWPRLFEGRYVNYYDLYKDRPDFIYDDIYDIDHLLSGYMDKSELGAVAKLRKNSVASLLGVPVDKITAALHEDCHTFYSYFGSPLRGETLALSSEGIGDYSNSTVSRFSEKGFQQLAYSTHNHLGHIYQYITLLLGMKPGQHEYKVMGLAPYANSYETKKSYKVFTKILKVNGLVIEFDEKPSDLYFHFRDALEGHRFDGIAGGLQLFLENILSEWVINAVNETGLDRIVFSGGVSQNIKANMKLLELDQVSDLYVCPAAGDTSLSVGACYYGMWKYLQDNGMDTECLHPFDDIYQGPEYSNQDAERAIDEVGLAGRYTIRRGVSDDEIAGMLADGMILARCCGRMEFGLRSLGNRSILADPSNPNSLPRINSAIKHRDFWMPFTPSILAERADDYLINPKNARCPYMTLAFNTTPLAKKHLLSALHPADHTARPQVLERDANPGYYDIIKAFERKTGVGAILNTSFNLHGDPVVLGPKPAIHTLEHSDLDGLILEDLLILRNRV